MESRRVQVIEARLDVLATVLQAVCQVLDGDQAAAVLAAVREKVDARVLLGMDPMVDEGIASELAPVLSALHASARSGRALAAQQLA